MRQVLLVDKNYIALSIISVKKAIKLIVKGKAEEIDSVGKIYVQCINKQFSISTILRLMISVPWRAHESRGKFCRKNIAIRDSYSCQYCGIKIGKNGGTIDHVMPVSRGGKTDYTNCVLCCKSCNSIKRDRTPEQAGMPLKSKPRKPGFASIYKQYLSAEYPPEWATYIIGGS